MIRKTICVGLAIFLTACGGSQYAINTDKEEHERWVTERKTDIANTFRGPWCDGKKMTWFYEGPKSWSWSCADGGTFTLRKD